MLRYVCRLACGGQKLEPIATVLITNDLGDLFPHASINDVHRGQDDEQKSEQSSPQALTISHGEMKINHHAAAANHRCLTLTSTTAYGPPMPRMDAPLRFFSAQAAAMRATVEKDSPAAAVPATMSAHEYRTAHEIVVDNASGHATPDPIMSFRDAGFPQPLLDVLQRSGYTHPSPIQAQGWPIANAGLDLIAVASTGSGKTAGYLMPALAHIREARKRATESASMAKGNVSSPPVLVLAPTRELAQQIQQEALKFGAALGLRTACLYGGARRGEQLMSIMRGPHIVVATPGRLLDFTEGGELDLTKVSYMVLDEADRMLDMGFEPDLHLLAKYIPRARQTLFFSATWPIEVQRIAERFAINRPTKVFVGKVSDRPVAAKTIKQLFTFLSAHEKLAALKKYIASKPPGSRIMVFVSQKVKCDFIVASLHAGQHDGDMIRAAAIHGDKRQGDRDYAIKNFKSGKVPVLVATDVASRGLDIPNVTSVVNFDVPNDPESYVHRIGRTGRAGAAGESMTLLTRADSHMAGKIMRIMREAGQQPSQELIELAGLNGAPPLPYGQGRRSSDGGGYGGSNRSGSAGGREQGGGRHGGGGGSGSGGRGGSYGRERGHVRH